MKSLLWSTLFFFTILTSSFAYGSRMQRSLDFLQRNYDEKVTSKVTGYVHRKFCKRDYVTVTGVDPLSKSGELRKVKLKVYRNYLWKKDDPTGRSKTVLVIPTLEGVTQMDNLYSNYWCVRYPFRIIVVHSWPDYLTLRIDANNHDNDFLSAITAIRHAIEYADVEKIGVIGNSLGAIYASMLMGVDERVTAGVLVVGGGNIPEVLGNSKVDRLAYIRNKRMQQYGLKTREEYVSYLRERISIDPLDFAPILRKRKIYFTMDADDFHVPTKNQQELVRAIEPEKFSSLHLGHVMAVIWSSIYLKKTYATYFMRSI